MISFCQSFIEGDDRINRHLNSHAGEPFYLGGIAIDYCIFHGSEQFSYLQFFHSLSPVFAARQSSGIIDWLKRNLCEDQSVDSLSH